METIAKCDQESTTSSGKESEIEFLIKRKRNEEIRKSHYHWSLLRNSVRNTVSAVSETDVRDIEIVHGIHHIRKMNHPYTIEKVAMINKRREYISTDGRTFRIFLEDGRKKTNIIPEEAMDRVLYSSQTDQYVGWLHQSDELFLMELDELEIISQVRTPGKIYLCTYNSNTGEVLAVGPHFISTIAFRYGARHLIPNKSIKTDYGEDNMFQYMVLEDTASHSQRLYLTLHNSVVVYNLHHGQMLTHRKDLHVRPITAITFFNPLKYLITGALDGTIKVWDDKWHIVMVFVGHSEKVNALSIYPNGPAIISASTDHTIRVWHLETCDEVDRIAISEPVDGLGTELQYDMFYTFSGKKIDLWQLQHVYNIHTAIGHRVNSIKMTTHPFFPSRAVIICSDSSIRIVSPNNGNVITSLIMEQFSGVVDAAYAINEDTLFTVMGNGDIVKSDTSTNPCQIVQRWKYSKPEEMCNYLLVYEYIVDIMAEGDIWEAAKRGATTRNVKNLANTTSNSKNRNRTLLLGGRKDGYICVFNWVTGEIDFEIEAHGSKGVLNMIANSRQDQLISAGMDNVIKIWRLYPFAEEALAPLMSFYCAHTPAHMTTLKNSLCVAFQDPTTATFSTVLYNLNDKMFTNTMCNVDAFQNRFDHKPDDDHDDIVTGLTVCQRMKLFATSSQDGTVRIWNQTNNLIRILKLNVIPYSIGFCSNKGDLLVGLGRHLFKIPHSSYMPKTYRFKMVTMKFRKELEEEPLPYNDNLLNIMNKNDVKRLKNSKSSFKFDHYVDILSPEEEAAIQREKDVREKAFSNLLCRDDELKQLKKGDIKANRISVKNKHTQDEAFTNYMKMFYDKPKITLPKEDPYLLDTANDKLNREKKVDGYRPETEPTGFFPNKLPKKSILKSTSKPSEPQKILPGGFIPNSVLAKILYPPPPSPETIKTSEYRPPSLTLEQLQQIDDFSFETEDKRRSVTFRSDNDDQISRVIDMGDYDEESPRSSLPKTPSPAPSNKSDEDAFWGKVKTPPPVTATTPTNKFAGLLAMTPTPKVEEPEEPEPKPVREPTPPKQPPKRERPPVKPIARLVSKPATVSIPPQKLPTPVPTPTPPPPPKPVTPPRPVTPLPEFITQYENTDWFQKYFPTISPETWPKPWTSDAFCMSLLKILKTTEFPNKTAVTEVLISLHLQEGFTDSTCQLASRIIISILNDKKQAPVSAVDQEKTFIMVAVKALNSLSVKDKEYLSEMILQYLDGDKDVRMLVCDILANCGLQDPHRQLEKELDSWDIWNIDEEDRKKELRNMCYQWLDRWMTSYKLHIEDTIERMKKGQNIHSRITKSQLQKHKVKKRGSGVSVMDDQGTVTTLPDGAEFIARHVADQDRQSHTSASSSSRSLTMMYNKLPDVNLSESATYIDAISYFCDMMVEKELEAIRRGQSAQPATKTTEKLTQNKNTVLVLPRIPRKQALVRLGETHTLSSKQKKTEYCLPSVLSRGRHHIPGDITGFVPAINLPLKTVYMNPFPNPLDAYDARFQEPILITLKSEQKFFIQNNSIVPIEYAAAPSS